MFAFMKRLPTAVRQLAERHARFKGAVMRLEKRMVELQEQLDKARSKQDAAGLLLTRLEERVRLEQVRPISEHPSAYGKRGALINAMLEFLRASGSKWVSTAELSRAMQSRFRLEFETWYLESVWVRSMRVTLTRLVARGTLERSQAGARRGDSALWRIKQEQGRFSLSDLRALLGPDEDLAGA